MKSREREREGGGLTVAKCHVVRNGVALSRC